MIMSCLGWLAWAPPFPRRWPAGFHIRLLLEMLFLTQFDSIQI